MATLRSPLQWPHGRARRPADERRRATFSKGGRALSLNQALARLHAEVDRYTRLHQPYRAQPDLVVVTTNYRTRKDGQLHAGATDPADPAVCVYFTLDGVDLALPCDTFDRVADNVAAVAGHIEADRAQERYGVATVRQRYASFLALPAAGEGSGRAWWEVLGVSRNVVPADFEEVQGAYRRLLHTVHPDKPGGSRAAYDEVRSAWEQARALLERR